MDIEKTYSTHEIEKPIGSLSLVRNRHGRETIHYLLLYTSNLLIDNYIIHCRHSFVQIWFSDTLVCQT